MRGRLYHANFDETLIIKLLRYDDDGYFYYEINDDRRLIGWLSTGELRSFYVWHNPKMPRFTKEQLERVK